MNKPTKHPRPTKVVTGRVRLSYSHVWDPVSVNGGDPKYSGAFIIRKDDSDTIDNINAAVDAAIEAGIAKFGAKVFGNRAALKLPLRDGDTEREDEAYKNSYFVNASSFSAPRIVDRSVMPITDRDEVYSGCYVRASINFYPYSKAGSKGVAAGLGNIQKLDDGEPLGGRSTAEEDFGGGQDDDFLA